MKKQKKVKKFREELDKQLNKFLERYNTSYKIYEDKKGIVLAFSLVSNGENKQFDANVLYRFSIEDILQKDITYFIKADKGLQEVKQELNSEVWKKYLTKE